MFGKTLRRVLFTAVLGVGALGSTGFAQARYYYAPRPEWRERHEYREWQAREAWRRHEWYEHHVWRDGRWYWR